MNEEQIAIEFGLAAAQLAYNAYSEKYDGVTLADKFIELGLKFFPREALAASLTRSGVVIAEAAADALETAKFGPAP